MTSRFVIAAAVVLALNGLSGAPAARIGHAMTSADSGVFMIGGGAGPDGLWHWRNGIWTMAARGGPTQRMMTAAAFDSRRHRLVVFGGTGHRNGSRYGDTWEWDGQAWHERDARTPGARDHHAMAYDAARGTVVMYGGWNADHTEFPVDTWTWDGETWSRRPDGPNPGQRGHHAMAYDSKRQRVVLYGGIARDGALAADDVWEWDGAAWSAIKAPGPGALSHIKMAYDDARGVIVMAGGGVPGKDGHPSEDTWTWNGVEWHRFSNGPEGPASRSMHAMAYDPERRRVVLFGGQRGRQPFTALGDTWTWEGSQWVEARDGVASVPTQPPSPTLSLAGVGYDDARERLVVVGGTERFETWEHDGKAWQRAALAGDIPDPRTEALVAYDTARKRVVMFGGQHGANGLADTWSWNGASWQPLATTGPAARLGAAMAYDGARDRLVLFGGGAGAAEFNDTWEWDGGKWTKVNTSSAPPARALHAMAFDQRRGRVVLFGGFHFQDGRPVQLGDMWEWDGRTWRSIAAPGPSARDHVAMTWSPAAGAVILHGGGTSNGLQGDTWSYDGAAWSRMTDSGPARGRHRLVWSTRDKGVVLYGGWGPDRYQSVETWLLANGAWTRR